MEFHGLCPWGRNLNKTVREETLKRKSGLQSALVLIGLMMVALIASVCFGGTGTGMNRAIRNEWKKEKHSQTQKDVATELAGSHPGETPQEVVRAENCIACHGPTAVLVSGGMTEGQALGLLLFNKRRSIHCQDPGHQDRPVAGSRL